MILAKASLSCDHSFIVLASVITIVNYYHKTFIVQATGYSATFLQYQKTSYPIAFLL